MRRGKKCGSSESNSAEKLFLYFLVVGLLRLYSVRLFSFRAVEVDVFGAVSSAS